MENIVTYEMKISGALLALLQYYHQKYEDKRSLQYVIEDCLQAGVDAKRRSKEYSEKTENRKRFEKAIASDPTVVLRPADMLTLMKKYGIGSSNANLEKQVMEAAEAIAEAELEKATAPTPAPVTAISSAAA